MSEKNVAGQTFIFPTETVYGLGACIFDEVAIKRIYEIKGRDFSKPLAAHLGAFEDVELLCEEVPDIFYILAEHFLPGPLSIVLPKVSQNVPKIVTSAMDTIAIRFPDNRIFRELIAKIGKPMAATSANISGEEAPTSFSEVNPLILQQVNTAIDGGECSYKLASTVLSVVDKPKILRAGAIDILEIEEVIKTKLS